MTEIPETRYTRWADGTRLAYQVSGKGPLDLVFPGTGPMPIELLWDDPGFIRVSNRLGTFSRIIWFQIRGLGASEGDVQDLFLGETSNADLAAVLEAAGVERVVLAGWNASGQGATASRSRILKVCGPSS